MTIKSKAPTDEYRDGWDRIFGKKKEEPKEQPKEKRKGQRNNARVAQSGDAPDLNPVK